MLKEMTNESYKKIVLRHEDGDEAYIETVWGFDLGNERYRLDNCPFCFYGVTSGDIIQAKYSESGEQLFFTKIIEKSGNKLVRVIFDNPADEEGLEKNHLDSLVAMGCSFEGANPKYICIEIPKRLELFEVCNYLTEHEIQWEHVVPTYTELYPNDQITPRSDNKHLARSAFLHMIQTTWGR